MSVNKKNIQVCFSPFLFSKFSNRDSIVIVVDVLRATSCICTALSNGAQSVKPVKHIFEILDLKDKTDYILPLMILIMLGTMIIEVFRKNKTPFLLQEFY